jgi:predicted ester cyclase
MADLEVRYRAYIDCLNRRDWTRLSDFVSEKVRYNGEKVGLAGYRGMLERDVYEIPDLRFGIGLLVVQPPHVAARLLFTCAPKGTFLGLPVNGRTVSFSENVIYRFGAGGIEEVWSVIDKAAIQHQLFL